VLQELILSTLREIGAEWERGAFEVGQEHFASNLLRERMLALARLWGRGSGPLAILACAPGERHDIGLIGFGLVLRSHGWRILFLGADTPLATLAGAVTATEPDLVVVSAVEPQRFESEAAGLRRLARTTRLVLSGPGAEESVCARLKIEHLNGDLVAAAHAV
jgi:methanogenic corrinoid protein MtbC1